MQLYGLFEDGYLKDGPRELPAAIKTGFGETVSGINTLRNDWVRLRAYNWYPVKSLTVESSELFEKVVFSAWFLEDGFIKRNHVILKKNFTQVLRSLFKILDKNRESYEASGFAYNYNGIDVVVLTDKASQHRLAIAEMKAKKGERPETDVWPFRDLNGDTLLLPLSNKELLSISHSIYRKSQEAYSLASQTSWELLGAETTEALQHLIESGQIDLNPWAPKQENIPWQALEE